LENSERGKTDQNRSRIFLKRLVRKPLKILKLHFGGKRHNILNNIRPTTDKGAAQLELGGNIFVLSTLLLAVPEEESTTAIVPIIILTSSSLLVLTELLVPLIVYRSRIQQESLKVL